MDYLKSIGRNSNGIQIGLSQFQIQSEIHLLLLTILTNWALVPNLIAQKSKLIKS